jgi:hypothetical protein
MEAWPRLSSPHKSEKPGNGLDPGLRSGILVSVCSERGLSRSASSWNPAHAKTIMRTRSTAATAGKDG